jgi:hypothetical protein
MQAEKRTKSAKTTVFDKPRTTRNKRTTFKKGIFFGFSFGFLLAFRDHNSRQQTTKFGASILWRAWEANFAFFAVKILCVLCG